ncbi:hypothetical protein GC174_18380 [bacterium]|nr:hypothetical protein [bacterium]
MSISAEIQEQSRTTVDSGDLTPGLRNQQILSVGDNQNLITMRDSSTAQSFTDQNFGQVTILDDQTKPQEPSAKPVEVAQVKDANDVAENARRAYYDWGAGLAGLQAAERVLNGEGPLNPDQSSEDRTRNANAWNALDGGANGVCLAARNGSSAVMTNIIAGKINGRVELSDGGSCQ